MPGNLCQKDARGVRRVGDTDFLLDPPNNEQADHFRFVEENERVLNRGE